MDDFKDFKKKIRIVDTPKRFIDAEVNFADNNIIYHIGQNTYGKNYDNIIVKANTLEEALAIFNEERR